jgi:dTDP-glucose 4,6-dehydratase
MSSIGTVTPLFREDLDHVFTHTSGLWAEARGCTFFITGGTGFFGMWLLESFAYINDSLDLGMRAVILTRNPAAFAQKAPHLVRRDDIALIKGDIASFAFPSGKFPFVIHAATDVSDKINTGAPEQILSATIDGTRRVLEFAAQAATRNLLLTSSGAVYGRFPPGMTHVPETHTGAPDPLQPGSVYGIGKIVSEHMCMLAAKRHGFEIKIARCFVVVGPHLPLDNHFAIGNFIRDALAKAPIVIKGDGTPTRSYLYMADLAIWLWTILFRGQNARAYNTGSDLSRTIAEVAAETNTALGTCSPVHIAQQHKPGLPVSHYVPDTTRARTELGLKTHFDITQSIQRTVRWLRASCATR